MVTALKHGLLNQDGDFPFVESEDPDTSDHISAAHHTQPDAEVLSSAVGSCPGLTGHCEVPGPQSTAKVVPSRQDELQHLGNEAETTLIARF